MKTSRREAPSASQEPMDASHATRADAASMPLYRVGGVAALMIAVFFLIELMGVIATGLPPSTVIGWFTLIQHDRLRALFDLFCLDMLAMTLSVPLFLALYAALRRASPWFMALATVLAFVGIAVYFASNTAFNLLSLSDYYAAATTAAQRSLFEAAGQAALAGITSSPGSSLGIYMGFTLPAIAGLIISVVMLRSTVFSKATAFVGILGNVLQFGPPSQFVPASWDSFFVVLVGVAGVVLVIWYVLIALKLFQLARGISKEEVNQPAEAEDHESHRG
jgi:hypothetical protein